MNGRKEPLWNARHWSCDVWSAKPPNKPGDDSMKRVKGAVVGVGSRIGLSFSAAETKE